MEHTAPLLGETIADRFRLDYLLGAGAMSRVYAGRIMPRGSDIAVKVLREKTEDPAASQRFLREARILSELDHPNLIGVIGFGEDEERDIRYVVMDLARGDDLVELTRAGRLQIPHAVEIAAQVADGLAEAHSAGIVHRDLKPANIKLVPDEDGGFTALLLDFGLARNIDERLRLTEEGYAPGTTPYMAPEQFRGSDTDARGDIYSLGVLLYEMLTGFQPFRDENPVIVSLKHLEEEAIPLEDWAPQIIVPDELTSIVEELLSKAPDARPQSSIEVRDRLRLLRDSIGEPPPVFHRGKSQSVAYHWRLLPRPRPPIVGQPTTFKVDNQ